MALTSRPHESDAPKEQGMHQNGDRSKSTLAPRSPVPRRGANPSKVMRPVESLKSVSRRDRPFFMIHGSHSLPSPRRWSSPNIETAPQKRGADNSYPEVLLPPGRSYFFWKRIRRETPA